MYPHKDAPATRYYADSYTYLQFAREMRSFYRAHYREPLFPALTKAALVLLGDQDIAVSFVSGLFSVLAVVATYWLGTLAFSRGVGLAAALAMAIERDEISWGVSGWRDSAFTFAVVMFAWAAVKYLRAPSRRTALWLGAWAAVGCLLRITALSYVIPGGVAVLIAVGRPWAIRRREAGVAVLMLAVFVGPYLFNCWRVFGDPLYAINYHTGNYLVAEGAATLSPPSAAAYIGAKVFDHPYRTFDTALLGVTSYPFFVKWHGFDPWGAWLGRFLSAAAVVGFVVLLGFPSGRLLLFVALMSQLPFSVTWTVAPDWRFTEHLYPFFLIMSFVPVALALRGVWPLVRPWPERMARSRYFWGSVACGISVVGWLAVDVLPAGVAREAIDAGEGGSLVAGGRDYPFFAGPWSGAVTEGNVTFRVPTASGAVIRLPLPRAEDYELTLRMDPFPRPLTPVPTLPSVSVFVNDHLVSRQPLRWNPDRVGAYAVSVPRAVARAGTNDLALMLDGGLADGLPPASGLGEGSSLRVWLVRVWRSQGPEK